MKALLIKVDGTSIIYLMTSSFNHQMKWY